MPMRMTDYEATHAKHINWAIWFSALDVDQLEKGMLTAYGGWEEVKHMVYEFVRDSNFQGTDHDPHYVGNLTGPSGKFLSALTGEVMKSVARELRMVLDAIADKSRYVLQLGEGWSPQPRELSIEWSSVTDLHRYRQGIMIKGGPVAKILWAFLLHLVYSNLAAERVRRCPMCKTIFIRDKRKPQKGREAYCSPTCKQGAATQRYRLKHKISRQGEEARSEGAAEKPKTRKSRK